MTNTLQSALMRELDDGFWDHLRLRVLVGGPTEKELLGFIAELDAKAGERDESMQRAYKEWFKQPLLAMIAAGGTGTPGKVTVSK